jgi:hypothetical protein
MRIYSVAAILFSMLSWACGAPPASVNTPAAGTAPASAQAQSASAARSAGPLGPLPPRASMPPPGVRGSAFGELKIIDGLSLCEEKRLSELRGNATEAFELAKTCTPTMAAKGNLVRGAIKDSAPAFTLQHCRASKVSALPFGTARAEPWRTKAIRPPHSKAPPPWRLASARLHSGCSAQARPTR